MMNIGGGSNASKIWDGSDYGDTGFGKVSAKGLMGFNEERLLSAT